MMKLNLYDISPPLQLCHVYFSLSCRNYEDDFEADEDDELQVLESDKFQLDDPPQRKGKPRPNSPEDDIYDFTDPNLGY